MSRDGFQPYWLAYADWLGVSPDSEHLKNADYISWILARRREFGKERKLGSDLWSLEDTAEFIPWLQKWVRENLVS